MGDDMMDEMMENADFAQDDDFHNMYPNSDGFSTNDPTNDWERDQFFGAEEEPFEDEPYDGPDFPIDPITFE